MGGGEVEGGRESGWEKKGYTCTCKKERGRRERGREGGREGEREGGREGERERERERLLLVQLHQMPLQQLLHQTSSQSLPSQQNPLPLPSN